MGLHPPGLERNLSPQSLCIAPLDSDLEHFAPPVSLHCIFTLYVEAPGTWEV